MSRPADLLEPLAPRPLSPHAGPGATPPTAPEDRERRRRHRHRAVLTAGAGALLAAVLGLAASATAVPTGESWGSELAVSGGDDVNVSMVDGAVRLATPSTAKARSEGVMLLPPRRPAAPTNAVTTELTADLPPGTSARVDVRGILPDGSWSRWFPTKDDVRTVLPAMTTQVQARVVMLGGSGSVSPAVERLWLTTSTTSAAPATGTAPAAPTTTTPAPTTTASAAPSPAPPSTTLIPIRPTTPAATPNAAPAPAAKPIWDAAITAQGLGMFKDTPWNMVGAKTPTVVPATGLTGRKALKFTMPGGGKRSEIEPNVDNFTEGQDRYIRLSVRLADGFPVDTDSWQLITQFKNEGEGSPPLELRIGGGNFVLSGGFGHPDGSKSFDKVIAPAAVGKVTTLVLHVKFSSTSSKSVVDAWVDGQQKVTGFRPPGGTMYPGDYSYWKLGLYRDTGISQASTYELSDAKLGDSYASVAG
ncbi:polysaccharide lyase [Actinomycetospora termitidis]|uniref:Polysaccharide lyase n=1 Tax=Actinomycetospora termitidis TaxID=3053470 RepID=A0ABT7M890_9PSEU|nr:polysaccharide lyase [Actinomycetospora sp. Odt1-22]MDL5156891.1 polysaccharide lyase [Actinomycetospora sp. Odt1-22]